MQKKTRTRIWSILLSMTMLLSLLPVTALAEGNTIYAGPNASGEGDGTQANPYADLSAAISAAGAGDTVMLTDDITISSQTSIAKNITLDLSTHTITGNTNWPLVVNGTVTFQNGTIEANSCSAGICISGGDVTASNLLIDTSKSGGGTGYIGSASGVYMNAGTFTLKSDSRILSNEVGIFILNQSVANVYGTVETISSFTSGDISGGYAAIQGNGTNQTAPGTTINIYEGAIVQASDTGMGIYHPQVGTVNIYGGTVTGSTGIGMKSGELNISGGSITGTRTKEYEEPYSKTNGIIGDGSAIIIDSYAGYAGNMDITISGNSKLTSQTGYAFREIGQDSGTNHLLSLKITGGEFSSRHTGGNIFVRDTVKDRVSITGGRFSGEPDEAYLASGYKAEQDGSYWVVGLSDGMSAAVTAPSSGGTSSSATVSGGYNGTETPDSAGTNEGTVDAGSTVTVNVQTGTDAGSDETVANESVTQTTVTVAQSALTSVNDAVNENRVEEVILETDVADLTIPGEAWRSMAAKAGSDDVEIAVQETTNNTSWEITAKAGTTDVFTDSSAPITISVPYTAATGITGVVVYCTDSGKEGAMKTTWLPSADGSTPGTLSWEAPHFSNYTALGIGADEATWVTTGGSTGSGTLATALEALDDVGGTITLHNNATLGDAEYSISKDITINGNNKQVTVTVKAGASATDNGNIAFNIRGSTLTLNNVDMTINGTKNTEEANGYDGTGFNVGKNGNLVVNQSKITVQSIERATTSGGGPSGTFTFNRSVVTFKNIDGNASNGGQFTFAEGSTVTVENCGSYGLSVNKLTVDASSVAIRNVNYSAVKTVDVNASVTVKNNGSISATNSGSGLPFPSKWGKAEGVIDLGHGSGNGIQESDTISDSAADLVVEKGSSINLSGNVGKDGADVNFVYLTEKATLDNKGSVTAVKMKDISSSSTNCAVRYVVDGQTAWYQVLEITDSKVTYAAPGNPANKAGYTFAGWSLSGGASGTSGSLSGVEAGKTYTFTATWSVIPTTPTTPSYGGSSGDDDSYSVSVPASSSIQGGSITVSPRSADKGDTVTITVKPDDGYELKTLTVTDSKGAQVSLTAKGSNQYTFKMPASRVSIDVSFRKIGAGLPFTDVAAGAWYADAVQFVYDNELMTGVTATEFGPNVTTSRAMLATILYRLEGEPNVTAASFTDVASGMYYTDAVAWASSKGIVTGYGDGTFLPNRAISREEMAAMLYRYASYKGYNVTNMKDLGGYSDAGSVSSYAVEALQWATGTGLITDMGDGTLTPAGPAVRAQIATILMRFLGE